MPFVLPISMFWTRLSEDTSYAIMKMFFNIPKFSFSPASQRPRENMNGSK